MPEAPKPKELNLTNENKKSTYAEVVKNSKIIYKNENKNKTENPKENNETVYVELNKNESSVKKADKASKERLVKEIIEEELTNQNISYRKKDKERIEETITDQNIPYRDEDSKLEDTNLDANTEIVPVRYLTQDEIIKQINAKYGIKEEDAPCWNCFSSDCTDKCNPTKTTLKKGDQTKLDEDNDDEDYPQNNICYECGKQLKW